MSCWSVAILETGLPLARLTGERGRTVGQLRLFADELRKGGWLGLRVDPALPDRKPAPRADLRLRKVPLGPVVVFGASNFPLAFSVAGGDTAAALAAGCPVIVKGHSAHPGTSDLVAQAVASAVQACDLPAGVFALLNGNSRALGAALVADPRVKAVGFTGSRAGGLALLKIASERAEPIPVYAEMSSINPVFLLPAALSGAAERLGARSSSARSRWASGSSVRIPAWRSRSTARPSSGSSLRQVLHLGRWRRASCSRRASMPRIKRAFSTCSNTTK